MNASEHDPQIGPLDVAAVALTGAGTSLESLLAELGVHLDADLADNAPPEGWRVLRQDDSGAVTVGAPADPTSTTWYIGEVGVDQHGTRRTTMSVYPEALPLRRSRAERAKGLSLRWPPLSRSEAADDVFVIDIVNTGDSRWRPDGDAFVVAGVLAAPGSDHTGAGFGFFGGQHPAVPLDPGEYARVPVSISEQQWSDLEPGHYEVRAALVMLPVAPATALTIEVTQAQIDRHAALLRARNARRTPRP